MQTAQRVFSYVAIGGNLAARASIVRLSDILWPIYAWPLVNRLLLSWRFVYTENLNTKKLSDARL